jgi:small subunit ribosomal protein S17e
MWRANKDLGKVRTEKIKSAAHELVKRFPSKFTTNFENNKESVEALTQISSKKLRNRIAGYITRLMTMTSPAQEPEPTEEEIEGETE